MRMPPPALAPYLRSHTQATVLALLLLQPEKQFTLADIARLTGEQPTVVHREVSRLVEAGVLGDTRVGRARLVHANPDYRLRRPLTEIIAATYGPPAVLQSLLSAVPEVEEAYVYGSWAARFTGVPGDQPGDVDVLVIGDVPRVRLNDVAAEAEDALRVPVTIHRLRRSAWLSDEDPFVRTVRERPLLRLELSR
ncbi:hypothetical protein ACFUMH_08295 [Cellulomonas sp. NPDC057328]|uniref:hypothetical protein n=1 Tax=Cellulomonas sp. NPDC057328 TaxID=3346101 RepID=UPI003630432D